VPITLTIAATLLAAACGTSSLQDEAAEGSPVAFEAILKTSHSGFDEPVKEVVRDPEHWTALWERMQRRLDPAPPLVAVDFNRHMLIVVGLGTRRSSGFNVTVQHVTLRGDRLQVEVLETCPGPDDMVGMALTQPVQVIRLAKLPQDAGFRETKGASCR
jgi:hypothetical protein